MAGPGKRGRRSNKEIAREANTKALGRSSDKTETSGDYAGYNLKPIPKSHRDFNRVLAHLNHTLESLHKNPPKGVSTVHVAAFEKLMEYAFREPIENVSIVKCPKCRKNHVIECPTCDEPHDINIPSATHEKNSIAALMKLTDKLAPNLAAVTQDININVLTSNITEWGVKIITQYVPIDARPTEIQALNQALSQATEADFEEVPNGK